MNRILFILAVTMFLGTSIVNAEPINYTFTGTATGSVDGAVFSNADVTITVSADTDNVLFDGYNVHPKEVAHQNACRCNCKNQEQGEIVCCE